MSRVKYEDHGMDWATEAIVNMGPCRVIRTEDRHTGENIQTELTGARGFAIVHTDENVFERVDLHPRNPMIRMYFYRYRDEIEDVKGTPESELYSQYVHTGACEQMLLLGGVLEITDFRDDVIYGLKWDDDPGRAEWGRQMQYKVVRIQARNFARLYTGFILEYLDGKRDDPKRHIRDIIDIVIDHYKGKNKGKRAMPYQVGYVAAADLARNDIIIGALKAAGRIK